MSTDAQFNAVRNEVGARISILWIFVIFLAFNTMELVLAAQIILWSLLIFKGVEFGWYTVKMWRGK